MNANPRTYFIKLIVDTLVEHHPTSPEETKTLLIQRLNTKNDDGSFVLSTKWRLKMRSKLPAVLRKLQTNMAGGGKKKRKSSGKRSGKKKRKSGGKRSVPTSFPPLFPPFVLPVVQYENISLWC